MCLGLTMKVTALHYKLTFIARTSHASSNQGVRSNTANTIVNRFMHPLHCTEAPRKTSLNRQLHGVHCSSFGATF